MSINWRLDVEPRPALLVLPPDAASLDEAHAAIELWEFYSRKKLDPTQRLTVQVMMAQAADGRWAASTTGREMPRQNGKGDEVEVVELWGLVQRSEAILHTVHDAVLLASQTQQRMLGVIEGHADLRRKKLRAWQGTGQQMIEMRNGGIIWYRTRTGGGGRGVDLVDRLVVDEAQHAQSEHLDALTPTLLANPNPQMNVLGTAGIAGKSAWWWSVRRRALSESSGKFGYIGHTAEQIHLDGKRVVRDDVDATDRTLWAAANPTIAAGRGQGMEFFEEQLQRLGPESFAREHLCVWDPDEGDLANRPIPADTWSNCEAPGSAIVSHDQWSVTVSPDRKWASFSIAGRNAEGRVHVECVDRRAGTAWVLGRATDIWKAKRIPIRIHKSAPEASFIATLREAGVDVVEVSSAEVAQATGRFIDDANAGVIAHLNQPWLNRALDGAELKVGADGASGWSQRTSTVEITPLMAATVALGGVPAEVKVGPQIFSYKPKEGR